MVGRRWAVRPVQRHAPAVARRVHVCRNAFVSVTYVRDRAVTLRRVRRVEVVGLARAVAAEEDDGRVAAGLRGAALQGGGSEDGFEQ